MKYSLGCVLVPGSDTELSKTIPADVRVFAVQHKRIGYVCDVTVDSLLILAESFSHLCQTGLRLGVEHAQGLDPLG